MKATKRKKAKPLAVRLEEKTLKTETCWLWNDGKSHAKYGNICDRLGPVRNVSVHRLAYELAYGPIPAEMNVLHKCDVRNCVNPEHLFLGSLADNNADCMAKGRAGVQIGKQPMVKQEYRKKVSDAIRRSFQEGRRMAIRLPNGRIAGTRIVNGQI
jgi:hypothetical protein